MTEGPSRRVVGLCVGGAVLALGVVAAAAIQTAPVRGSVRAYTELIAAANRQDVGAASGLCSSRYLATHDLRPADEGGVVGLPRNIHKNFTAWRDGGNVLLCPTNRVGPVYQFVPTPEGWRFDGPVGLVRGRGEFVRMSDMTDGEADVR